MPSKKPHVLLDDKYHSVLIKTRERRSKDGTSDENTIPKMLIRIFDTSSYFKKLQKDLKKK